MSWDPNRLKLSRVALAALLVTGAASAAANVLVVRSSGPVGRKLSAGHVAARQCAASRCAAATRSSCSAAAAPAPSAARAISARPPRSAPATQTDRADGRRARIGAVRSAGILPTQPGDDLAGRRVAERHRLRAPMRATSSCGGPTAARPSTPGDQRPGRRLAAGRLAGRRVDPRLAARPADRQRRRLSAPPGQRRGAVLGSRFKTLNSQPADLAGVAEALIQNGCQEQLDLLVDTAPTQ